MNRLVIWGEQNFDFDVVDKNVDKHRTRPIAEAFIKFLYTPESQREFAKLGFRPLT
ncbi:MAG: hypothetical protein V7K12_12425 [Nostoc sp.]